MLLFLIVLEVYFRLYSPQQIFDNHTTSAFGLPTAFRANLNSDRTERGLSFRIKTDSRHLRSFSPVVYEKPKNTFRILCLGGSIFAANGVNNDETFSYFLQKTFKENLPEHNIEVINTAKNSWEIAEYYTFIKNEGFKYSPDLIIAYFHTGELSTMDFSELEANTLEFKRMNSATVQIKIKGLSFNHHLNNLSVVTLNLIHNLPYYEKLFNISHLIRSLENLARNNLIKKVKYQNESDRLNLKNNMQKWKIKSSDHIHWKTEFGEIKNTNASQMENVLYSIALAKFYSLLKSINSKLLFLIVPAPQEVLKVEVYPENLIPFKIDLRQPFTLLNLLDPLEKFQEKNLFPLNLPNIIHWTPAGHHIAAKTTYQSILKAKFLPNISPIKENLLNLEDPLLVKTIGSSNARITSLLNKTGYDSYTKGVIYLKQNKLDLAEKYLKDSLDLQPNFMKALWGLAKLNYEKKDYQESLNILRNFPTNDSNADQIHTMQAMSYFKLRQFDKADLMFSKAISLSPENPFHHYNFGKSLFLRKNYKQAILELEKADHLLPNNVNILTTKGSTYFMMGNKLQAIKDYEQALMIDPKNQTIKSTLQIFKM